MCQLQAALTSIEHFCVSVLPMLHAAGAGTQLWNVEVGQQVEKQGEVFAFWTLDAGTMNRAALLALLMVEVETLSSVEHMVAGDARCITALANGSR